MKGMKDMENYIDEMFRRVNLQSIECFIMSGSEYKEVSYRSYHERLTDSEKPLLELLEQEISDPIKREKVKNAVYVAIAEEENIYMELGMKLGAILQRQLMG